MRDFVRSKMCSKYVKTCGKKKKGAGASMACLLCIGQPITKKKKMSDSATSPQQQDH